MELGPIDYLVAQTGLAEDLVKTLLILILNIVLSPVFRVIRSPKTKLTYSLVPGLIFTVYLIRQWALYVFAVVLLPYCFFLMSCKYRLAVACILGFLSLLFIHVYRFIYDYMTWRIDCSTIVMIMITKITYYALHLERNKAKPQFFRYMSYCFYFPGVLIGPTFSYATFDEFIESRSKDEMPLKPIFLRLLGTAILTACTMKIMTIFTPYWVLQNQTFQSLPYVIKFLSLNIIGLFYRLKFYSAWGIAQTSIDLSTISWDSTKKDYSKVIGGSIRFQLEPNIKKKTEYWNTEIQKWLKDVVYDALVKCVKSHSIAIYSTFMISAFWHGIYLTYYVGFLQWAIIIIITKWAYKCSLEMPKLAGNVFVKTLAYLMAASIFNYTGMFLLVLTWKQAMQFYASLNYIGNILMAILFVMTLTIKPKTLKQWFKSTKSD